MTQKSATLHPEIRQFWVERGVQLFALPVGEVSIYYHDGENHIAFLSDGEYRYCLEGQIYSEAEMLRVIALKAFL